MLTQERLKEVLNYDEETGLFTRKSSLGGQRAGSVSGTERPDGYRKIIIEGRGYYAHRLAWLYVHGKWPEYVVDHINGNPRDNRIINLRDVPRKLNQQNQKTHRPKSVSQLLGVSKNGPSWAARIYDIRGKAINLGSYPTPEKAHEVYLEAKRKYHPGCTI